LKFDAGRRRPGTYVTVGKGVFALIDSDTLRVEGHFEEAKLDKTKGQQSPSIGP
jgi:multidrug resistance efflux pump